MDFILRQKNEIFTRFYGERFSLEDLEKEYLPAAEAAPYITDTTVLLAEEIEGSGYYLKGHRVQCWILTSALTPM